MAQGSALSPARAPAGQSALRRDSRALNAETLVALALLVIVALFWAPFGLKTTDTGDGWALYSGADAAGFYRGHAGRPLLGLPWEIAVLISADSFVGAQLVLAALFWGKAYCLYLILRHLRVAESAPAFLIATLSIIFPADRGLFGLFALARHAAVFLHLLATLFMVLACQRSVRLYVPLMVIAVTMASLTSEAGYPLAVATPLVLLLCPECSRRAKLLISGLWYLSLAVCAWIFITGNIKYQTSHFTAGLNQGPFLTEALRSIVEAYRRAFVDQWWRIIQGLVRKPRFLPYALAITLVAGGAFWWLARTRNRQDAAANRTAKYLLGMALAGLFAFGLGFLPYAATDLRYDTVRVYYYSLAGAALTCGAVLLYLNRLIPAGKFILFGLLGSALIFLASVNALNQKATNSMRSRRQQQVLASIIEQAPDVGPGTAFMLYDESRRVPAFDDSRVAGTAINWVYDTRGLRAIRCDGSSEDCEFSSSGIEFRSDIPRLSGDYPYEEMLFFEYVPERGFVLASQIPPSLLADAGPASGYDPYKRISAYAPFPARPLKGFEADYAPRPEHVAPQGWNGDQATMDDRRVCNLAQHGQCALFIQGTGTLKTFSQEISAQGQAGEALTLSLWSRSAGIPAAGHSPQLIIEVFHADGTSASHSLVLDETGQDWIESHLSLVTVKPYSHLRLSLQAGLGSADIWFDDLSLTADSQPLPIANPSFEL